MNICTSCKHYKLIISHHVWIDPDRCYAKHIIDPITGYKISELCRKKNPDGKCIDFETKPPPQPKKSWWAWLIKRKNKND